MLAALSINAVQSLMGGPGRSPGAITSHNISRAGATAAVPMTVGRDSRRFIRMANMPSFFRFVGALKAGRATASRGQQVFLNAACGRAAGLDRKSTRLNSSHLGISYAVFCLKKKNRSIWQSLARRSYDY